MTIGIAMQIQHGLVSHQRGHGNLAAQQRQQAGVGRERLGPQQGRISLPVRGDGDGLHADSRQGEESEPQGAQRHVSAQELGRLGLQGVVIPVDVHEEGNHQGQYEQRKHQAAADHEVSSKLEGHVLPPLGGVIINRIRSRTEAGMVAAVSWNSARLLRGATRRQPREAAPLRTVLSKL